VVNMVNMIRREAPVTAHVTEAEAVSLAREFCGLQASAEAPKHAALSETRPIEAFFGIQLGC
jgi:hypothetical protein